MRPGRSHLAALAAAVAAAFAGATTPALSADDPTPTQLLPGLSQELPTKLEVRNADGQWRIGFDSEVTNLGPGYLKITGTGPGDETMVADQVIEMSDGSTTVRPAIGDMGYVRSFGHLHWHLLDFERYELRDASEPGVPIVRDQKTGYCLANAFTQDSCGWNHPELTTLSEGISVGGSDKYRAYLEGQYLAIDPTTTPDGAYLLVNRVNPTGALLELDETDNASSVRITIQWLRDGTPLVKPTNTCKGQIECPPPAGGDPPPVDDPAPQPKPGPEQPGGDQLPSDPTPPADQPADPGPQPLPIVVEPRGGAKPTRAVMSRAMALRLVRRAIHKSTRRAPKMLRTNCKRTASAVFRCSSNWKSVGGVRWSGRTKVWYRLRAGRLSWYYDLTAVRHPGGKRVVTRAARGSASSLAFGAGAGALLCVISSQRS